VTAFPAPSPSASASGPAAVQFQSVDAAYRRDDVLHDLNLSVAGGERVALIGPNGAGKSTVLRVLAGLLTPRSGRVTLLGRDVADISRPEIARRLAVVPQLAALPFAMAVEDVIGLGRLPHEDPWRGQRPADRAAIGAAIERVGLGHLLGRDARELSLGERQLVLLAMAVAQQAPVLLLDEPTVHLDLGHQVQVMDLLVDLNERDGITIVAVLHDLGLAAHFFPRLVLLDRGRVVGDGTPDEVLTADRVRSVFRVDPELVRPASAAGPGTAAL
jgi:iron complex transport system ATP-binding protein